MAAAALARQRSLLLALERGWRARGAVPQLFETHISWVYLVGGDAYKFKKALRFDVLDYSTLAARRRYCEAELALNRRLAPDLYLDVAAVTGAPERPELGGAAAAEHAPEHALEYAVHMRAFPQQALWSERLRAGVLAPAEVDALAARLADFHAAAARAPAASRWGRPEALRALARQDLASVAALLDAPAALAACRDLMRALATAAPPAALFRRRRAQGRVRECHGDLHCANILTLAGRVEAFDAIEFNPALRWLDAVNDLSFAVMDLRRHGRDDLALRLLDAYLSASGDYAGIALLDYYQARHAVARCKVTLLGAPSAAPDALSYLALAARPMAPGAAVLIMHGCSGSGKSHCARLLAAACGAVVLRSDVERKRLHGVAAATSMRAAPGAGIYGQADTAATYGQLLRAAEDIVGAGFPVVVDAACLLRWQRDGFAALARAHGLRCCIVDLRTDPAVMRSRLAARAPGADASDAGLQTLEYQLATREPLTAEEAGRALEAAGTDGTDGVGDAAHLAALALALSRGRP